MALAAGLGKPRMVEESDRLPNASFGGPDEVVLTKLAGENEPASGSCWEIRLSASFSSRGCGNQPSGKGIRSCGCRTVS